MIYVANGNILETVFVRPDGKESALKFKVVTSELLLCEPVSRFVDEL